MKTELYLDETTHPEAHNTPLITAQASLLKDGEAKRYSQDLYAKRDSFKPSLPETELKSSFLKADKKRNSHKRNSQMPSNEPLVSKISSSIKRHSVYVTTTNENSYDNMNNLPREVVYTAPKRLSVINGSMGTTLNKIQDLMKEVQVLTFEHQFIDQTFKNLLIDSESSNTEENEIFLLNVCENYLKRSIDSLKKAQENGKLPLIDSIEQENENILALVQQMTNSGCKRKWHEIHDSLAMKDEEIRSLHLQIERLTSFKQTLQASHDEFGVENKLYVEAIERHLSKSADDLKEITAEDWNRNRLIAETLVSDCQAKMIGDLAEIQESNAYLQEHLQNFESESNLMNHRVDDLQNLFSAIQSDSDHDSKRLAEELWALEDQVHEIQKFESEYSFKEADISKLFQLMDDKIEREKAKVPFLENTLASLDLNKPPRTEASGLDTFGKLFGLYEMRNKMQKDLEAELVSLEKEEAELKAVARIFDDLTVVPQTMSKLTR